MTITTTATLTELTGSPKQVSWAGNIRARRLNEIQGMIDVRIEDDPGIADAFGARMEQIARQPSAKWFIETRESMTIHLMDDLHRIARGTRSAVLTAWIDWGFEV